MGSRGRTFHRQPLNLAMQTSFTQRLLKIQNQPRIVDTMRIRLLIHRVLIPQSSDKLCPACRACFCCIFVYAPPREPVLCFSSVLIPVPESRGLFLLGCIVQDGFPTYFCLPVFYRRRYGLVFLCACLVPDALLALLAAVGGGDPVCDAPRFRENGVYVTSNGIFLSCFIVCWKGGEVQWVQTQVGSWEGADLVVYGEFLTCGSVIRR